MIAKTELEQHLIEIIDGAIGALALRVVDLDCVIVGHRKIDVFLERTDGVGLTLDECALASRTISKILETEALRGPYDLEVSSPGLDRRLRTLADFQRFSGSEVKMRLVAPLENRSNLRGIVNAVEKSNIVIGFEGKSMCVPIESIRRANLIWKEKSHAIGTR